MRFFVEVTTTSAPPETYCVACETWQKALQAARIARKEEGPISGFSIDLHETGCDALDPRTRTKYKVRSAPEDVAITHDVKVPPSTYPPKPGGGRAREGALEPSSTKLAAATAAAMPSAYSPANGQVLGSVLPYGLPDGVRLATRREEGHTPMLPLSYREETYVVPASMVDDDVGRFLFAQLVRIRNGLAPAPRGKYVKLAAFRGEAPNGMSGTPPAAIVSWRDWSGEPTIHFPMRIASDYPPAARGSASAALEAALPRSARPVASDSLMDPVIPNNPVPRLARNEAAAPIGSEAAAPMVAPDPYEVIARDPFAATPFPPAESQRRRPASARFAAQPGVRLRGDELIASLFEEMHDLHFLDDALQGGEFCLRLALDKVPARAGLVHFFDIAQREFVLARALGEGCSELLGQRSPDTDALLLPAMRKRGALILSEVVGDVPERYRTLGPLRSTLIIPVTITGRSLAAIELVNPNDGRPFTDEEANAFTYMAEQYADFIGTRGVVLDRQRIIAARGH